MRFGLRGKLIIAFLLIAVVPLFIVMVFVIGWDLSGKIISVFASLFTLMGLGSLKWPDTIGQVTLQLLRDIGEGKESYN